MKKIFASLFLIIYGCLTIGVWAQDIHCAIGKNCNSGQIESNLNTPLPENESCEDSHVSGFAIKEVLRNSSAIKKLSQLQFKSLSSYQYASLTIKASPLSKIKIEQRPKINETYLYLKNNVFLL